MTRNPFLSAAVFLLATGISNAATFTVNNVLDSGAGSLRFAIMDANSNRGLDSIEFDIPGIGPHTIRPQSGLPPITDPVVIDGYTQSGSIPNSNSSHSSTNAVLMIELDGSMAAAGPPPPSVHGLILAAGDSTVRGLVINRFVTGDGIRISTPTASVGGDGGNVIEGNFIGTDVTGTVGLGNNRAISIFNPGNAIGGTSPDAVNVLSGNESGVWIGSDLATGNLIEGNFIGIAADGTKPIGNSRDGIIFTRGGSPIGPSDNIVGGVANGAGNTIAFNGRAGILVNNNSSGNAILSNSIFENGTIESAAFGIGIDLANLAGVTANDAGDTDTGGNELQNYPVLTLASGNNAVIEGTLGSMASSIFRLEFFYSPACDPTDFGEGEIFIGSANVTTDSNGDIAFTASYPVTIPAGHFVTATATDPNNNTSEFSQCLESINLPVNIPPIETSDGGSCFIATAAYGSYLDPHVIALREFRDEYLLHSPIGRSLVSIYYRYSPPMADFIANRNWLRVLTRVLLTPLVFAVKYPLFAFLFLVTAGATARSIIRKARKRT